MKRILILCNLLFSFYAFGQFGQAHVISNEINSAQTIYAVDLDGDLDIDVLSSSQYDNEIYWHENVDGMGNFSPKQIISAEVEGPLTVFAADLDSDGDMDVLSSSYVNGFKIAWYENTDGQGNFGTQKIITTIVNGLRYIYTVDLDNDEDIDVISASTFDDKIAWYRNEDGLGTFSNQLFINFNAEQASSVFASDLDNDGDMDILSTSSGDNKVSWYENLDGLGDFSDEKIIDSFAYSARSVFAADLDNDNDIDVIAAAESSHELVWYENLDGFGNFSDEHIITTDVLTPVYVFVSDIDGDNDNDIILSDDTQNTISWFENLTNLSVSPNDVLIIDIYPNPTSGIININNSTTIDQIKIYNTLGQLVLSNSGKNKIDISDLKQGLYFMKIIDIEGSLGFKKVMKN